jgi:hypothetical protein
MWTVVDVSYCPHAQNFDFLDMRAEMDKGSEQFSAAM